MLSTRNIPPFIVSFCADSSKMASRVSTVAKCANPIRLLTTNNLLPPSSSLWFRSKLCSRHEYQKCKHNISLVSSSSCLVNQRRTMAGHSHWQNIRRTKTATDAKFGKEVSRLNGILKQAILDGGPEEKGNKKMTDVIEQMKKAGVPKQNIKSMIDNICNKSMQTAYIEITGPRGAIILVELQTANVKHDEFELRHLLKKTLGKVSQTMMYLSAFEQKGAVSVPVTEDMQVSNMDPYLEIAIEVGAEDVIITKDENNDQIIIKFHCDPKHLPRVTSEVQETHGLNVTNTEVEFTPLRYCVLEHEEDFKAVDTIIQKVENYTGVVRVIDNITVPEE
ncbi:probable transcriptional regulatory protein THEYE_A1868 [Mya arenaria]|uniref:probable transcriptional regulatory protein THEYE_A1868 n=1 Tax=Mya arenaria TaxID=6604 RepID=UPI0022E53612|nr:probable transcriptional regulatory protein THEYE_A1868 [Mya arenaria]